MEPLDLNLAFLPSWAKTPATSTPHFPEAEEGGEKREKKPARDRVGGRDLHRGERRRPGREERKWKEGRADPARHGARREKKSDRGPLEFVSRLEIAFLPERQALQSVVDQIRTSARAYPLLGLAKMFLSRPERCDVRLRFSKKSVPDGKTLFYQCHHCQIVTVREAEMIGHCLESHRDLYYKTERVQIEAPKGNFVTVARCELNGELLGPPNYHAFQSNIMRLYKNQFQHLSFERFKQSIVTLRDPELLKKWQEDAGWKTVYETLSPCDGAVDNHRLNSEAELIQHFKNYFLSKASATAREYVVPGELSRKCKDEEIASALRHQFNVESRFPIQLANRLRETFLKSGLHIFKGSKGVQYVNVARPQPLTTDPSLISDTVRVILEFLKDHSRVDRKMLSEAVHSKIEELLGGRPGDSAQTNLDGSDPMRVASISPVAQRLTEDLHWLIRQGHVIEYHLGGLELAKESQPKSNPKKNVDPVAKSADNTISTTVGTVGNQEPSCLGFSNTVSDTVSKQELKKGEAAVELREGKIKLLRELPPPPPLPRIEVVHEQESS